MLGEASNDKVALKLTYLRTFQEYHIYENEKEVLSTTKQDLAIDAWNSELEKNDLFPGNTLKTWKTRLCLICHEGLAASLEAEQKLCRLFHLFRK